MIFGASGSGTTTIGRALAKSLGCQHFEADDYLWASTPVPYTVMRSVKERSLLLQQDLDLVDNAYFLLSGALYGWNADLLQAFSMAVFVQAPTEVRLRRLKEREFSKWGQRVRPEGDMHKNHLEFLEWASAYDTGGLDIKSRALHEAWSKELAFPVIPIDGTLPLATIVESLLQRIKTELPVT